VRKAARI
jgi:methylmalonyl-CoA/ethylmalonyl-CoA epimerase